MRKKIRLDCNIFAPFFQVFGLAFLRLNFIAVSIQKYDKKIDIAIWYKIFVQICFYLQSAKDEWRLNSENHAKEKAKTE